MRRGTQISIAAVGATNRSESLSYRFFHQPDPFGAKTPENGKLKS